MAWSARGRHRRTRPARSLRLLIALLVGGLVAAVAPAPLVTPAVTAGPEPLEAVPDDAEPGPVDEAPAPTNEPLQPVDPSGLEPHDAPDPPDATVQASCSAGYVALTFDDGPAAGTPLVLDALKAKGARGTFFAVGSQVRRFPSLVARTQREGHRLANHTDHHERLTSLSDGAIRTTVSRADSSLRQAGTTPLKLVRPPYGATSERVRAVLRGAGYGHILWTVDPRDWAGPTTDQIVSRSLAGLRPNAVLLFHDGSPYATRTAAALPRIIDGARARGYCIGLLDAAGRVVPDQPPPKKVAPSVRVDEIAGADRVDTAVKVSRHGWPQGAPAAVVASNDRFVDALAASGLAGTINGPTLLSQRSVLDGRTAAELGRLQPETVYVVGSFAPAAVTAVRDRAPTVHHIAAGDPFELSAKLARALRDEGGDTATVYVASGNDFPDALAVGALASGLRRPVLLVRGHGDRARLLALAAELGVRETIVIGGTAAVADAAVSGMPGRQRLAGPNRAATALVVARRTDALGWNREPLVASGSTFPDGLSGGVLGGALRRPVLLSARERLSPETQVWIRDRSPSSVLMLGGRAAVGDGPRCQLRTGLDQPTRC